jgi:hypothetical protein
VGVDNVGTGPAVASMTQVVFTAPAGAPGPVTLVNSTPGIAPADPPVDVVFDFPTMCFSVDCTLTITVNSTGTVIEDAVGSKNNFATGLCLGGSIGLRRR